MKASSLRQMLFTVISIFFCLQTACCNENMNNKIIDILKETLQKDNDDYKDITSNNLASTTIGSKSSLPPKAEATKPTNSNSTSLGGDVVKRNNTNRPTTSGKQVKRSNLNWRAPAGVEIKHDNLNRLTPGEGEGKRNNFIFSNPGGDEVKRNNLNRRVLGKHEVKRNNWNRRTPDRDEEDRNSWNKRNPGGDEEKRNSWNRPTPSVEEDESKNWNRPTPGDNMKRTALANQAGYQKQDLNRYPKYVNKEKVEKIAKFIEKYQGLVTNIMGSTPAAGAGGQTKPVLRVMEKVGRMGSLGGSGDTEPNERLPSAHELDMSPAIGGHINRLRMKQRLCQRHVMNPEGPKYDSKGHVYLQGLPSDIHVHFESTRAKGLILPKCCNCCAKSVLGCE